MELARDVLVLNGLIALLLGFACGAPLGSAINRARPEEIVRAWRVAHSSLVSGGVMLLAIASAVAHLALPRAVLLAAAGALAASMYAFAYALIAGARNGHRGLEDKGGTAARTIYWSNLGGIALSTGSVTVFACGAWVTLWRSVSP